MAVNFPDSPSNDDIHTVGSQTFIYKSSIPGWQRQVSGVNLSSVAQDILPDADSSRSLGSASKKWKDLHLSSSTIFLGDSSSISAGAGGEIILPSIKVGTGDNAVKLSASATGALQTQSVVAGVSQSVQPAGGTVQVADLAAMQAISNPSIGDMVSVVSNKTIYMYNGTGFYKIAVMVNESPSAITGVDGSYSLATDGTATTITAISSDPEGRALSWSYAVTSGSLTNGGGTTATIAQGTGVNTHVFTITPTTNSAYQGSFSITFNVTDNINGAVNAVSAFTLSFVVVNSRYTALAVKATNTGSNQTFDDASASNHTITASGDTTASTLSPYRHGGYSLGLDGTNDYLQVPQTTDLDLTGDFTVECWAYFNDTAGGSGLMGKWGGSGLFGWTLYATAADFWFYTGNSGSSATQGAFTFGAPAVNQWYHLAVSRTGSTISTYVNGTRTTTITDSNNCTANTTLIVGSDGSSLSAWSVDGYMRDVRIVNGTGLYTGTSFAVPIEPLTAVTNTKFLLGRLPYFKDQSTSNHTITVVNASLRSKSVFDNGAYSEASHGASAYFDGTTGNRLTIAGNSDFAFGTGDFSISCWIYFKDLTTSGYESIIDARNSGTDTGAWQFGINSNAGNALKIMFSIQSSGSAMTPILISNTDTIINRWYYISVSRTGTTSKLHLNGTEVASNASDSTNYSVVPASIHAGSTWSGSHRLNGYLSDIRVVKGTGLSDYTPPTAPLTAVTNTKFLLNPETSISDLSQRNALITVGGVATSTTQVKFSGTKSIYIGAQGDYINSIHDSTIPIFPNGDSQDWTLEYWYYPTNIAGFNNIFNIGDGFYMYALNGGLGFYTENGGSYLLGQNQFHFVTENTWSHVAIVRNGNNYNAYVDGVSRYNNTNSNEVQTGTNNLHIGDMTPYNNGALNFYIQDFRITKGLARYTSTFTPSTAELEG